MDIAGEDTLSVSKYRGVQKIEAVTVSELNAYVLKSDPQEVDSLCTTKVTAIQTKNGWSYISCSKCSRKLHRGISSLKCTACHDSNAVGVLRYRVEMAVSDSSDQAVFVAFDTDITRLTNVRAADAVHPMGLGVQRNETTEVPQFLQAIVGKTCTFHLKLSTYNFSPKHQSFTVSRIYDGRGRLPTPTFLAQGGDDMPGDNMPGIAIAKKKEICADNNVQEPTALTPSNQHPHHIELPTSAIVEATTSGSTAEGPNLPAKEPAPKKSRKN